MHLRVANPPAAVIQYKLDAEIVKHAWYKTSATRVPQHYIVLLKKRLHASIEGIILLLFHKSKKCLLAMKKKSKIKQPKGRQNLFSLLLSIKGMCDASGKVTATHSEHKSGEMHSR